MSWRKAAALTSFLNDPLPRLLSPHFCLPLFQEGGAFVRQKQGDLKKQGVEGGHVTTNKNSAVTPPKSNQEPLIHALNRHWVPWERLIQSGHRQPRTGLRQFRLFFPLLSFCSHFWTQLYLLKDHAIHQPSLSFYVPLFFSSFFF